MNAKRPNSMRHLDDAIRRGCGGNQAAYGRGSRGVDEQYQALAEGMAVIQDVGEAIEWANALVSQIATA